MADSPPRPPPDDQLVEAIREGLEGMDMDMDPLRAVPAVESVLNAVTGIAEDVAGMVDGIITDAHLNDRPTLDLASVSADIARRVAPSPLRWIEPVKVATPLLRAGDGDSDANSAPTLSSVDGIALDHLDRVLVTGSSDDVEPGVYEYHRAVRAHPGHPGEYHGQLMRMDNDDPPQALAVFVAEGSYADCAFLYHPEGDGQWLQWGTDPLAIQSCLTAEAELDDVQRAAENWTPEAVARFFAVLHHRRHHKDEDEEKDGGTFSVKLDKAIQDYTRVIELKPKGVNAYLMRGLAYLKKEKGEGIMAEIKHMAFHLSKHEGPVFSESLERAVDDFSRAIELDPQLASAYSYRAEAYRIKGMIEEALRDSNIVIRLWRNNQSTARAYATRAKIYRKLGQNELSETNFRKSIEIDPYTPDYPPLHVPLLDPCISDTSTLKTISRLGLLGLIVVIFIVIFKLTLPAPKKRD